MLVHAVADYIVLKGTGDPKNPVTPLNLEKLLYYAQGWHLALRDEPLFDEEIEAWRFGPVVPAIYRRFRFFGNKPIEASAITNPEALLSPASMSIIDQVLEHYGRFTSSELVGMTHRESPWKDTWGNKPSDDEGHDVINTSQIRDFFLQAHQDALAGGVAGPATDTDLALIDEILAE